MKSEDYVPQYDDSVFEFLPAHPEKGVWQINENYCLQLGSARVLASLFSPVPEIFAAAPTPQAPGSPFEFNHFVPWFTFTGVVVPGAEGTVTAERNAGQLAIYWGMPGVPLSEALNMAKLDIATPVEGL